MFEAQPEVRLPLCNQVLNSVLLVVESGPLNRSARVVTGDALLDNGGARIRYAVPCREPSLQVAHRLSAQQGGSGKSSASALRAKAPTSASARRAGDEALAEVMD